MKEILEKLYSTGDISDCELKLLIENTDGNISALLTYYADTVRKKYYGKKVFLRGLIEISNYCKNDCLYCGIRRSNKNAVRYRLTREDILSCCEEGYSLGFRTFVMQGGEDSFFTDDFLCGLISDIKIKYPDCAVTLSLGERPYKSYKVLRQAGADRYLLRHETADSGLYSRLHPSEMSLENRKQCLYNLREIGYQVGSGFMVGVPFQTAENLIQDIRFLQDLKPQMIGIGAFIPHHDTPFAREKSGTLELTLKMLGILRLMFPKALIPATTALGTISSTGREEGLKNGCNVVMPNLSPVAVRKKYELYDNKICTGEESAECVSCMTRRIESIGYEVFSGRGDAI